MLSLFAFPFLWADARAHVCVCVYVSCMSSVLFCGIPHSQPNAWEVHQAPPATALKSHHDSPHFSLEVHELKFYADIYNEHHTCCWPRLVLDAHLGKSAEEVAHAQAAVTAAENVKQTFFGPSAAAADAAKASLSLYTNHMAEVMEQLYMTQQEKVPRAAYARRALFHQGVPPVLRCHEHSDSFAYVLSGQLRLFHSCRLRTSVSDHQFDGRESRCSHGPTADDLARDVFPLVLIMAPGDDCALYVDAEPPVASAATQWRAKPLVLALESVEPVGSPSLDESGVEHEVWCGAYAPFTWICNPFGNQKVSVLIKSTAAMRRMPRTQKHDTAKSAASTQKAIARQIESPDTTAPASLQPLQLSFIVHASQYACEAAKERIVRALASSDVYNLHVTKCMRFGLGGADFYKRAVLGADEEALSHARSRRPAQLMRLLDDKLELVADATSRVTKPEERLHSSFADGASRESVGSPSLKVPRHEGDGEPPSSAADAECSLPRLVPSVAAYPIAQLCTRRPIEREWCRLPKSITLASVLPGPTGITPSHSGWPLRVLPHASEGSGPVVELSSLATLQDLAAALRSVSP
ncbi:conserved hypothetical protein [Leishmania major strain Friedlin]|uniref:Cyclic nucleotide-binding domain-containing protein n=1 Tax=Leishmania major TaxID=5664 RepID=E9AFA7_LEIMA|nr:conserved hypothetical protein [Leishmania major strain Friedlin]CAG9582636.1 hypothetical_protein_-_conserved [Leishmania major strain Friedlin]CBZ12911.1 conserved hypothetical protein [Leishmania major strain Friedlin]|eukprot:XP_003722677.1 conserved hypothetical protein [Leishmania major strain Friedlin]